jgi:hypothetical protein
LGSLVCAFAFVDAAQAMIITEHSRCNAAKMPEGGVVIGQMSHSTIDA